MTIGRRGSIHGAITVKMPARILITKNAID
jgi:hypothetical protein